MPASDPSPAPAPPSPAAAAPPAAAVVDPVDTEGQKIRRPPAPRHKKLVPVKKRAAERP